ncbi:MAG: GNAT family N-acetyltransferase [Oscillospiraceae bacterium]|nr:GNAT family N-acetyltransferase [Oscillospiraceae bacterium]
MITYKEMTKNNIKEALEFWAGVPGVHLHDNGEDTYEGILLYLERNPGFSFIAESDGEIAGAVLCGHDGRRGFINHLAVGTSYRHQGIGRHLVDLTLDRLKNNNITKCALFVIKENTSGQEFYKAIDFSQENIVNVFSKVL